MTPRSTKRTGWRLGLRWGVVCTFACLLFVVLVFPYSVLPAMARWLDVGRPPRQATFAMVMPGGAETRPFVAAAMVRRGLVESVLVPGTASSPLVDDGVLPPSQEINRRVLLARDVPDDRILLLPVVSGSSWNDAEALRDFLADHPNATVSVITNDFHTRRARWVFRRVLENRAEDVTFVSAPIDQFGPEDWWKYRKGLQTYLGEYCKFAIYLLRYGGLPFWLAVVTPVLLLIAIRLRRRSAQAG